MTSREQEAIDSLAPDQWEIFKAKIKAECEQMARVTPIDFRYTDTSQSFAVERFENGVALRILRLRFDPAVPRIMWQCLDPSEKKGWITFQHRGDRLFYVVDSRVVTDRELIQLLTMCLTGQLR